MSSGTGRSNQEIIAICEGAFQPFSPVVELQDYDHKIRVAVHPPNAGQIKVFEGEPIEPLRHGEKLYELLRSGRRRVRDFGFRPNPWVHDPQ